MHFNLERHGTPIVVRTAMSPIWAESMLLQGGCCVANLDVSYSTLNLLEARQHERTSHVLTVVAGADLEDPEMDGPLSLVGFPSH